MIGKDSKMKTFYDDGDNDVIKRKEEKYAKDLKVDPMNKALDSISHGPLLYE